jgi:RES domain
MIHDQGLVDKLSALSVERYEGEVFRATGITAEPLASSVSGGRWVPRAQDGLDVPVLYTSLERDGALEVVSYLMLLTPLPSKPLKVARLGVSTARTLRLARASLVELGVDMARYGERDYGHTQSIGAALAFLSLDGLIAQSARWPCDNLTIFTSNSHLSERLDVIGVEHVNWGAWAREKGFLADE